jgi:hypothetical protein
MLVFIDESGDSGFSAEKGSSPVFALAMVVFDSHEEAARTQSLIVRTRVRLGVKPEFKFNKCRAELRDDFFDAVADCSFRVRAVVVRKAAVRSARLGSDKDSFYRFFLRRMMRLDDGLLTDARVIIDGSGDRQFKKNLSAFIRRHAQADAVRQISLKSSTSEPLLQLADMCVGRDRKGTSAR